ncbi:GPH family transporter [Klebsiella pneumoniae]|uniref:GPH family transporter n=1 Tax=Klebsiella pneumoniae TaxID=573 RepID=A0A378FUB2_KLEPN|nr:GPH family transporter [Klebsiella pneumoniae]
MRILLLTLCNVCPGFIRMAATMYYVTWVMGQSTHFATLFISLGVVGMMIGSMLAKVLTDRWCKLQVSSGPISCWPCSPAPSISLIHTPPR